jgi:3-oxoacyl-[acyl-carrier-protein] synthase II
VIDLSLSGLGVICSLGGSWTETWEALLAGRRGISDTKTTLCYSQMSSSVSAVRELDRRLVEGQLIEGAASRLACYACREAMQGYDPSLPIVVFGGSTHGESDILFDLARRNGFQSTQLSPVGWRGLIEDSLAAQVIDLGDGGTWVYSSCTSSLHALILAALELQDDASSFKQALVVGVDALSILGTEGFARIGAASPNNCIPFHECRNGTLVGEGAAALMLRTSRIDNAEVPGRLAGFGMSCEALHHTRPGESGDSLASAIHQALSHAEAEPCDIVAVVLHGTGTQQNDAAELNALKQVFGKRIPPVTSIKGAIGHTMGAAGLFNALVGIQASADRVLPPTWSDGSAIMSDIDLVVGEPRGLPSEGMVLVNSSGFGGNSVAAVFARQLH